MLNISIVLYKPKWEGEVLPLVRELLKVRHLGVIYLVDNSPVAQPNIPMKSEEIVGWAEKVRYIFSGRNLGYGKGHNVAVRETVYAQVAYHLVMNADVVLKAEDIDTLYDFMETQPLVGQLMPRVVYPNGEVQYLCKLLPTPLDVFGRRFFPKWLMAKRNARYELRQSGYDRPMNVPFLSGCFMFLRTEAILKAGLFDERYFMYLEDVDLTRTIHRDYLTLFYPAVTIVHNHEQGSYHSVRLLWVHVRSMCKYFRKWGWFFDRERKQFNRQLLAELGGQKK